MYDGPCVTKFTQGPLLLRQFIRDLALLFAMFTFI